MQEKSEKIKKTFVNQNNCYIFVQLKLLVMEKNLKMIKKNISLNVLPETKRMLDELRIITGLPVGSIADIVIKKYYNEQKQ